MKPLAIVAVVVLMLGATTAFSAQQPLMTVGVDLNAEGNEAAQLGEIDTCREVAVGDVFEVDVYVTGIPPVEGTSGGLLGFSYNVLFEAGVVQINALDNQLLIAEDGGSAPFEVIDADFTNPDTRSPLPATTGNLRIDFVDLNARFESGDGVLTRLTVEAVGEGESIISLSDDLAPVSSPTILNSASTETYAAEVGSARISVGEPCESPPTPLVLATPTPTPGAADGSPQPTDGAPTTPTDGPATGGGATALAVDVATDGNAATELGEVQECARAEVGDSFLVDVVIEDVSELLAFEVHVTYDPDVLQVQERDTDFFLGAGDGSEILDTSQRVPDSTGRFSAGAVDTADPLSPESGSGVLVRLTMAAVAEGTSAISVRGYDLDGSEDIDRGVLLRDVDGGIIGDEDGDTFFDGPIGDAEVRIGADCDDSDARVVLSSGSETPNGDDDGGDSLWIIAAIVVATLAASGGVAYFVMRRRQASSL